MLSRLVKFTAKPDQHDELARLLLDVAESMHETPGCLMYIISRAVEDPDAVWVTELWESREAIDASLQSLETDSGRAWLATVMSLVAAPPERIDLHPLGGVGLDN